MKYLILLSLVLTGCGGSGGGDGSSTHAPGNNLPPSCKSLYSVWTSTTDLEQHDFSNLIGGVIENEYEYKAPGFHFAISFTKQNILPEFNSD